MNFDDLNVLKDINWFKREAKRILFSKGNQTKLVLLCILATFALMIPVLIYIYLSSLMMTLFDEEGTNILLSFILPALPTLLGMVFISFPAISGVYLCGRKIYCGEKCSFIEGFTENYKRNIAFGAILILRWIPAIAILILAFILPQMITEAIMRPLGSILNDVITSSETISLFVDTEWLISTLINGTLSVTFLLLALLAAVTMIMLLGKLFLFPYFISNGYEIKNALRASKEIMRDPQKKRNHRKFLTSFAGLLCLSLLTLGLLLIFYVAPLMIITYNELAEHSVNDESINL